MVVDDVDEGGGHASVKSRFYEANTACGLFVEELNPMLKVNAMTGSYRVPKR